MTMRTKTIVKDTKAISFTFCEDSLAQAGKDERIVFVSFLTLEKFRVDGVTKFGHTTKNARDTVENAQTFKTKKLAEGFREVTQKDFLQLLRSVPA